MNHSNEAVIHFDGSSIGNGEADSWAGAGAVVEFRGKKHSVSLALPRGSTCNEAEYSALILGISRAKELGAKRLRIFGDSMLVVRQVTLKWKTNKTALLSLRDAARIELATFTSYSLAHCPRAQNCEADKLAHDAARSQIKSARAEGTLHFS
jgi:ribonuclease HI